MNAGDRALFLKVIDFLNGMIPIENGTIQTEYGMMEIDKEWGTLHTGDVENMVELIQRCIDIDFPPTMEEKEADFEIYDEEEEEKVEGKQLPDGKIIYSCSECPHWEAEFNGFGGCGETIGKCNHTNMLGAEVIYETRGYRFDYDEEVYDDCPLADEGEEIEISDPNADLEAHLQREAEEQKKRTPIFGLSESERKKFGELK